MKKYLPFLMTLILLCLTACGKNDAASGTEDGQEAQEEQEDAGGQEDRDEAKDQADLENADEQASLEEAGGMESGHDAAVKNLAYGNDPNNLLQLAHAPCFGEGRAYYINFNNEVASYSLDGSDAKAHGTVGNLSEMSSGALYLNWHDGSVYYMITQYREDYTRYVEVRAMDVQTGEETTIETNEESDNVMSNGMMILGDNLLYSCYDPQTDDTTVTVVNLASQDKNQIFHGKAQAGNFAALFTTDGKSLYLFIPDSSYRVYKMALSALYDEEPSYERLADIPTASTALTEDGIYTTLADPDTHSNSYVFYAYGDSGEDWTFQVLLPEAPSDNAASEEDIIRNLVWRSGKWFLGDTLACLSWLNDHLYLSSTYDYTQSAFVGEAAYEDSSENGSGLYAGVYEGVLYLILEDQNGVSFHTLTADGTYR